MAARVRTLPAIAAPVLVGTALAIRDGEFDVFAFLCALAGALLIQIGTNLANDYSDAHRGADTEERIGPVRVTAGGLVPPRQVLLAVYVTFGLAALCGVYLVVVAGWPLVVVGVLSILAGVAYTGGPRPYGYVGLGEVFVFIFFGVVAVTGSYYVQIQELPWIAFALSVPIGLLGAVILLVNNIRDIDTDRRSGKRTVAVRLGRERARTLFACVVLGAYATLPVIALGLTAWTLLPLLTLPLALRLIATVRGHTDGPTLNEALAASGRLELAFALTLAAGILLS
ncbi:MAG TPA: 1,4-dihydroxy-2-naphthoate polyprenyltransferase [Solirubrobacteraceae bacterium]|nr:1,4-dihydroxy-2-naphthoate polyprenyltransferase [Solirubrobacteraceae bacterium]